MSSSTRIGWCPPRGPFDREEEYSPQGIAKEETAFFLLEKVRTLHKIFFALGMIPIT